MTREDGFMKSYDEEDVIQEYKYYSNTDLHMENDNTHQSEYKKDSFKTDISNTTNKTTDNLYKQNKNKSSIKKIISIFIILGLFLFMSTNDEIKNQIASILNFESSNNEEYLLANSNSEYLTEEDLIGYSKEELAYIRNEIFARHGFIFGKEKYKVYFESKSWYNPNPDFKGNYEELNKYEESNVELILKLENR